MSTSRSLDSLIPRFCSFWSTLNYHMFETERTAAKDGTFQNPAAATKEIIELPSPS